MRTLVDIPEEDLTLLKRIGEAESLSRAELVRRAISNYLKPHRRIAPLKAFGLWAGKPGRRKWRDGLEYEEKIRSEWQP